MDAPNDTSLRSATTVDNGVQLRDFGQKLGEVARLWRIQIDRHVKPLGLSFMQWLTLVQLANLGEEVVQKDLAQRVGIEGPTMVGVLDRLVKADLVERRVAAHDRRANTVHLTAGGQRMLRDAERELQKLRTALLADLTDDEMAMGIAVFERIAARARVL